MKRPLLDGDDQGVVKKHIVAGKNGSPQVNGCDELDGEDAFADKLELFRKEAIWRRMKHYSRETERCQARIRELERHKSTCEAGLAAISACWQQLIDTIRSLVKPDDLPQVTVQAQDILHLTTQIQTDPPEDLNAALGDSVNATHALLSTFVRLNSQNHIQLPTGPGYSELIVLRSELETLRTRLAHCQTERDGYHIALLTAENKYARSQSATVRELEASMHRAGGSENGSEVKEEVSQSTQQLQVQHHAPSPVGTPSIGYGASEEMEVLKEQLRVREQKIVELEHESALLRDRQVLFELDDKAPSPERLKDTAWLRAINEQTANLDNLVRSKDEVCNKLLHEMDQLNQGRITWEKGVMNAANEVLQDMKMMLAKRDAENARLREQRDQQTAELNERKGRDGAKLSSLQELRKLGDIHTERLKIYQSEVSRYRARLAAEAGDDDLLRFFLRNSDGDVDVLKSLRSRVAEMEERIAALESTISQASPDVAGCLARQAELTAELSSARKAVERYERTYGDLTRLAPDVSALASQLRMLEGEVTRLRLVEAQFVESEKSLFGELEKLSTAWEEQDRQLKDRVYSLAGLEERVARLATDKAKADNKFFSIMREKEAGDNERQKLIKAVERQEKAIARLEEGDQHLKQQVNIVSHQFAAAKRRAEALETQVVDATNHWRVHEQTAELERRRGAEALGRLSERDKEVNTRSAALRRAEDEVVRARKELERQLADAKRASNSTKRSTINKNLEHIAFCSICKGRTRDTIITKCMHTFCKDCVDARLTTRQRKCPYCNLAFGQADVHALFFN